jgi:hypothetical protein
MESINLNGPSGNRTESAMSLWPRKPKPVTRSAVRNFAQGSAQYAGRFLPGGRIFIQRLRDVALQSAMRIYVYVSQQDPDILGFTSDETGANLPERHGPWREEIEPSVVVIDTDDDPIAKTVRRHGFYVFTDCSDC